MNNTKNLLAAAAVLDALAARMAQGETVARDEIESAIVAVETAAKAIR